MASEAIDPTAVVSGDYEEIKDKSAFAIFTDYEPRTEDMGLNFFALTLALCLAAYLVLLPFAVVVGKAYAKRPRAIDKGGTRRRSKGITVLARNGTIETELQDDDQRDDHNIKNRFVKVWDQFQDEEYSVVDPELERHPWNQLSSQPTRSKSYCTLLITSMLELYHPQQRSYFHRQRQQRRKRAFIRLVREESATIDRKKESSIPESCDKPLLREGSDEQSLLRCLDVEASKRILRFMVPFVSPAMIQSLLQFSTLAIVGLGLKSTSDLAAYLIVQGFVVKWTLQGVSSGWFGALQELTRSSSLATPTQTGQYTQISMTLLIASVMPLWILWALVIQDLLLWLKMDEGTIDAAISYTYIAMVLALLKAITESVHFLLIRANHATYCNTVILLEECLILVVSGLWGWLGTADLVTFGLVQLELAVTFFVWTVGVALYSGWLDDYQSGLLGSCAASNRTVLWKIVDTAAPLIVGNILLGSTWEILMFLAAFLGPAEFTTFCILGVLWDAMTSWLDGVAFIVSMRYEALMMLGYPQQAFSSSVHSMAVFIVLPAVLLAVLLLVIPQGMLASWITRDETLQVLLTDLLPLLQIGLVITAINSASWGVMTVQGRNHVSAFVAWVAALSVTIPLATTFSVHLLMDLQGQTMAYILGCLLSGTIQSYLVATSRLDESLKEIATATSSSGHSVQSSEQRPPDPVAFNRSKATRVSRATRAPRTTTSKPYSPIPPDPELELQSTSSSGSPDSGVFDYVDDEVRSDEASAWCIGDDSTLSTGGSSMMSMMSMSSVSVSVSAVTPPDPPSASSSVHSSSQHTPDKVKRVYSMNSASTSETPDAKVHARNMTSLLNGRSAGPMSPVMEESSSIASDSGATTTVSQTASEWMAASVATTSSTESESKAEQAPTRRSDLGNMSKAELTCRQGDLTKMLNALKATREYELTRSKLRILEELRWTLLESPDIFEVKHLERIIGLLRVDSDCRKELWTPLCHYLPEPLQRMGLSKLLHNDYLGAHHLKARMDKFVLDSRLGEDGCIQDDVDSFVDDDKVHRSCELPPCFSFPTCFVLRKVKVEEGGW